MFATANYCSCFWLLLCLALSLLEHAYAQTNIGDKCSTPGGAGLCQLIDQCPWEINRLRSGQHPGKPCGFQGSTPIICCPSQETSRPVPEVVKPKVTELSENSTARRMCAEYENYYFDQLVKKVGHGRRIPGTFPINKVKSTDFPHLAAVGYKMGSEISWDCAGTLISDRFVLTVAHCTISPQWGEAQWVRLGSLESSSNNNNSQVIRINERIRHPQYQRPVKYNDIALLKLERPVTFNIHVMPACLDNQKNHKAGKMTVAAGWGLTDFMDDDSRPDSLLKVKLPIVAHSNCSSFYSDGSSELPHGIDDQSQICAGGNGELTCQVSGSPLMVKHKPLTLHRVVGITSFGQLCGINAPGVYTRVSFYVPWIEGIVWPDKLV